MRKLSLILLASALLAGCSGTAASATASASVPADSSAPASTAPAASVASTSSSLSILAPYGAPALSLIPAFKTGCQITTVDGADPLQAAFVNPSPEYDVIIAPTNLGMKLYQAGKSEYELLSVVTWGNLYIVADSDDALQKQGEFAAFGEQAVSGLVFNSEYTSITPNITWYNSVTEAQAALLAGKANAALLAEPAATATIAKAKEAGKELKIIADLQANFNGGEGYPQAGMFVRKSSYEADPGKFEDLAASMATYFDNLPDDDTTQLKADIDSIGTETLGIPSSEIVTKVWKRMNIRIIAAGSVQDKITSFLSLFGIQKADGIIQ